MSALDQVAEALADDASLVRAVASGRRRNHTVPFRRIEIRYVDLNAGRHLQVTGFDETQAHTRNIPLQDVAAEVALLVETAYSHWYVETTTETLQVRFTKKGRPLVHAAPASSRADPDRGHDRKKRRLLDESDPVFRALGISTADGRVKPTRVAKFRQVQDLLKALDPVIDDAVALGPGPALSELRPLRVVDLGCGNAYLTFGAYQYLAVGRGLPVRVTGVDVKAQSRAHNSDLAGELGVADHLQFVQSAIGDVEIADEPDLVLALHACDTATDDALARAVRWRVPVIVAAPCCHHDIQRQLGGQPAPEPYGLVTRHPILRERLADVLTDALRAAVLRLLGYRVEVFEFVDSAHTPRNALIRAVRTDAAVSDDLRVAYADLTRQWNVVPALVDRLADVHPELLELGPTR